METLPEESLLKIIPKKTTGRPCRSRRGDSRIALPLAGTIIGGGQPMYYGSDMRGRRSIRLRGYDYSHTGAYFVTVVTRHRLCLFGDVADGEARLNHLGRLVEDAWQRLEARYPYVILDEYVVMPNHLHGVIVITDVGHNPLGRLVGAFKMVSAKQVNLARGTVGRPLWQRNYFEHVIRGEVELDRIRAYIRNNPSGWETDSENPAATAASAGRPPL